MKRDQTPPAITWGRPTWLGRFWVGTRAGRIVEIHFGLPAPSHEADDPLGRQVACQIFEFLEGDRHAFEVAPDQIEWSVMPPVHAAMLRTLYETIRWGDVVAYGELAAMAGFPGAARAAGLACRQSPFAILVPAHRVIAAGGRLGGYLGRPDIKRRLLAREGSGPFRD